MKQEVKKILDLAVRNADREDEGLDIDTPKLNRVFLGRPGTGKTTVAKLYGRVLADVGMLRNGEVLVRLPSDFLGAAVGESERNTRAIVEAAKGNVLLIDEAYNLFKSAGAGVGGGNSSFFGSDVLNTLVELIPGDCAADFVVLMCGYRKEMDDMFKNCNPGLSRRLQYDRPVLFEDYDSEALLAILRKMAADAQLSMEFATVRAAVQQLDKARLMPNFGNGGAVRDLLDRARIPSSPLAECQ